MIGQEVPDFELSNQDGQPVHLSDYRGKKVVIFAFPKAFTPGCNAQACGFRDEFTEFQVLNAVVLGISPDSQDTLKRWKAEKNLPYDLLSDPDHALLESWGAWGIPLVGSLKIPMVNRSYWVLDEHGVIIDEKVNVPPTISVYKALSAVGVKVIQLG